MAEPKDPSFLEPPNVAPGAFLSEGAAMTFQQERLEFLLWWRRKAKRDQRAWMLVTIAMIILLLSSWSSVWNASTQLTACEQKLAATEKSQP